MPSLENMTMRVVQTSPLGVINQQTLFHFRQKKNRVLARYAGGRIDRGYLLGEVQGNHLQFRFVQLQSDGRLDHGKSNCQIIRSEEGKVRLTEHFSWGSRKGTGQNIMEEIQEK